MKNTTDQQNLKNQILKAIELYNELYSNSLAKAIRGELISKGKLSRYEEFLKTFKEKTESSPEKASVYAFENSQTGERFTIDYTLTQAEETLYNKLANLGSFAQVIESAIASLSANEKAKEVQSYLQSGAESLGDNSENLQQSLNLFALVHAEYTKPADKKKTERSEVEIVEAIIKKVVSEKEDFEQVDLFNDVTTKAYLDAMVEANENQIQISTIQNIFELLAGSVDTLAFLRKKYADQIIEREIIIQSINQRQKKQVSFETDKETAKTLKTMMEEASSRVLEIVKGKTPSLDEISAYKRQQLAEVHAVLQSLDGVDKAFRNLEQAIARYNEKYEDLFASIPARLQEISDAKNMTTVGGLVGGIIEGVACDKVQNSATGEWEIVNKSEEDKFLTDVDAINTLFNRAMIHESAILSKFYEKMQQTHESDEIIEIAKSFERKFENAYKMLDSDFEVVLSIYADLLDYKLKIVKIPYESKRAISRYLRDFNPIVNQTGSQYFSDERLAKIRENGRRACTEATDHQKLYYNHLVKLLACGVVDNIDGRFIREENQPISEFISAKEIVDSIVTMNISGEERSILEIIEENDYANRILELPNSGTQDLMVLLADERVEAKLNGMVPIIGLEVGFSTLETLLQVAFGREKHPTKLVNNLNAFDGVMKLDTIKGQAFFQSDEFYKYLATSLPQIDKYKRHHQANIRSLMYERMKVRSDDDPRFNHLIDTFETYYVGWLNNLHIMEERRIEEGKELITDGRDLEREKKILERNQKFLARFVGDAEAV